MAVDAVYLPENIEQRMTGGPRFSTTIMSNPSGSEYRLSRAPRLPGQWQCTIGYREEGIDNSDILTVINMFWAARGRVHGFLFKDWGDYKATNQTLLEVEGETNTFQLRKLYGTTARSYSRKITRPRNGTVVIRNSGVVIAASIDHDKGWVVPISGSLATLTATFEFDVPVRFANDELEIETLIDGLQNIGSINLVEILE